MRTIDCPNPHCAYRLRLPTVGNRGVATCPVCKICFDHDPQAMPLAVRRGGAISERHDQAQAITANELADMGRVRPVRLPPTDLEHRIVPVRCSDSGNEYDVTFSKSRLGEPFRLSSIKPSSQYLGMFTRLGAKVEQSGASTIDMDDLEWAGFQCFECGRGTGAGDASDVWKCSGCGNLFCLASSVLINGGGKTVRCPICKFVARTIPGDGMTVKAERVATRMPDSPAPSLPAPDAPRSLGLLGRVTRLLR